MTRLDKIRAALEKALKPSFIEVIDDSAEHYGHAGSLTGKGHFTVRISTHYLHNKSRLEQHRLIYEALGELMQTDIHALSIQVID